MKPAARLLEILFHKTPRESVGRIQSSILQMVCNDSQPMPLDENTLTEALMLEGEFLLLEIDYDELRKQMERRTLEREATEALSIVVSYEDDGKRLESIETSLKFFHDNLDAIQNFRFGIRRVEKHSDTPIRILFSGILPINQLQLTFGEGIAKLIDSHRSYYHERFQALRIEASRNIGIPILPISATVDPQLPPFKARVQERVGGRIVSEFSMPGHTDSQDIEAFLLKIFHIFPNP